jgi:alcohol dehydrogenase class IV
VLEYSKPNCTGRLADLARASGLDRGEGNAALADKFIAHVRKLKADFDIPEGLKDLRPQDIPAIADAALSEAHMSYAVPRYMDQAACEAVVRQMLA